MPAAVAPTAAAPTARAVPAVVDAGGTVVVTGPPPPPVVGPGPPVDGAVGPLCESMTLFGPSHHEGKPGRFCASPVVTYAGTLVIGWNAHGMPVCHPTTVPRNASTSGG